MPARGKPGKPNPGFPPFPPPLEIAGAIPTFPQLRRLFLYKKTKHPGEAENRLAKEINQLGWAKIKCRSGPRVLAKSRELSK